MISYQLKCSSGHEFEAWFLSSGAYDEQRAAGDVGCPLCGDQEIAKALMAPNVASRKESTRSSHEPRAREDSAHEARAEEVAREIVEAAHKLRDHVVQNCDDVGTEFAEEARKIHYGETEERGIYGEATPEETQDLNEEGINVFRLPTGPRRNG